MCDFNAVGGRFPFLKRKDREAEEREISRSTRELNEESSVPKEKKFMRLVPKNLETGRLRTLKNKNIVSTKQR